MSGKVFVTRRLPSEALERLAASPLVQQLEVSPHDRPITREELHAAAAGCGCLVSQLVDPIDASLFEATPGLKLVANYAVGFDNVDVAAATARGVLVSNTPGVLSETTADLTFALILAVMRRVVEADRYLRAGKFDGWAPLLLLGGDVHGKTLGIVGLGGIGRAVARRARGFGMTILYTGPTQKEPEVELGSRFVPLEELLATADIVSLHCPLNAATRHLLNAERLALLKPTAALINVGRGPLVDERALVDALAAGRLGGAGLDVFEREPAVEPGLLGRDDVVLLPHVGSATRETRSAMAAIAVDNVLDVLAGDLPRTCVNPAALANRA